MIKIRNIFSLYIINNVLLLTFFLSLPTYSCREKGDVVPDVYVNFYIYLSDPQGFNLNIPGNFIIDRRYGVNGVIVYRVSQDEFTAYDLTCTYHPSSNCVVSVDSSALFLTCPCCKSKFSLTSYGGVEHGPASRPLKAYRTSFDGTNVVHVFN